MLAAITLISLRPWGQAQSAQDFFCDLHEQTGQDLKCASLISPLNPGSLDYNLTFNEKVNADTISSSKS